MEHDCKSDTSLMPVGNTLYICPRPRRPEHWFSWGATPPGADVGSTSEDSAALVQKLGSEGKKDDRLGCG